MRDVERLDRLEETVFFQERSLNELHEALTGQQRRIDALERALEAANTRIAELIDRVENGASGPANVPPPHYQDR